MATYHKLSSIAYAQGFVDDFIEKSTQLREVPEDADEEFKQQLENDNDHMFQVKNMWRVVTEGVDQLRRENTSLQNKLTLIDLARNTET